MSAITLQLPDDLAGLLSKYRDRLPEIIEEAIRSQEFGPTPFDPKRFGDLAEIFQFLAGLPAPEEIMSFEPSERLQQRSHELLEKNRNEGLTSQEEEEMNYFEFIEHLVRKAKVRAAIKLRLASTHNA